MLLGKSIIKLLNNTLCGLNCLGIICISAVVIAENNFLPVTEQNIGDKCNPPKHSCKQDNIYYTYDGSCNNLEFTFWGEAKRPYTRLVAASYSDAGFQNLKINVQPDRTMKLISTITCGSPKKFPPFCKADSCGLRKTSDGKPLPPARKIRTTVLSNEEKSSSLNNILFNAFGQWFTHDITRIQTINSTSKCCTENPVVTDTCLPLIIPSDDSFYGPFSQTCIENTRAINTRTQGCSDVPCLPINFQTGMLDLSILYGADENTIKKIRSFSNGELLISDMFPTVIKDKSACPVGGVDADSCMVTGDPRINLVPELTMMEIIFLRAHNNIAATLLKNHWKWDDERIFQEARRILIAIYKQILFAELLPAYIGFQVAGEYDLLPASKGQVNKYDSELNPQTPLEYAFVAGRSHHSMIRGTISYEEEGESITYKLRDKYFGQRFLLEDNVFSNLMEAFYIENSNRQSEHYSEEVSNFLFFVAGGNSGSDLPSTDINRGLDCGAATYNAIREACDLKKFNSFEEFDDEIMDPDTIAKLKSVYPSIDDVDFYVGGLLERPLSDALVGPSFACIIAETFRRLKFGDRLHYEFPQAKFRTGQLKTIRQATFAYLLCLSHPNLKSVPKYAFLVPSYFNPLIPCDGIAAVDLMLF